MCLENERRNFMSLSLSLSLSLQKICETRKSLKFFLGTKFCLPPFLSSLSNLELYFYLEVLITFSTRPPTTTEKI